MKNSLWIIAAVLLVGVIFYEWRKRKGSALFSVFSQAETAQNPNSGDPSQSLA